MRNKIINKAQIKTNYKVDALIFGKRCQIKTNYRVNALICAKQAQIKMMETISVLLVFLILITFVVIFYVNISRSSASSAGEDLSSLKAIEISQLIAYMPEFQCSSKNIVDENCFDILKMEAFEDFTKGTTQGAKALNTTYYDLFEHSTIVVYEIYPSSSQSWVIYNSTPIRINREKMVFIPLVLYDASENINTFGMLNVTVYS